MAFVFLGFKNAWRNLGRSAVAVVAMAVAAAALTSSATLGAGRPAGAHRAYRQFVGGEIVAYSGSFAMSQELAADTAAGRALVFDRLAPDHVTDLVHFQPQAYVQGFVRPGDVPPRWDDAAPALAAAQSVPGVAGAAPVLFLPAVEPAPAPAGGTLAAAGALRGRDVAWDLGSGFAERVVAGRPFGPDDAGRYVALVDAHRSQAPWPGLSPEDAARRPAYRPGSTIRVAVPRVAAGGDRPAFDYSRPLVVELEVVGVYELRTNLDGPPRFFATAEILVPEDTLAAIYREASGGAPPRSPQLVIRTESMLQVERVAAELRRVLPGYTVVSVPQHVILAGDPPGVGGAGALSFPLDLSVAFTVLVTLVGALLVASNMTVLMAARRREIGILKAVGARGFDVVLMIGGEALSLAAVGTAAGYAVMRAVTAWNFASNRVGLAEFGALTAVDLGRVAAWTLGLTLVFAAIPAARAARMTAMEVFRNA